MGELQPADILAGRTSRRTSPLLVAGIVVSGVALLVGLFVYVALGGAVPTAIGFVLALPTTIACVGLVLLVDRLEPEPRRMLAFAFLWGAGLATLIALVVNTAGEGLVFDPLFGARTGRYLTAVVGAPIVEETIKGAALLLLLWWRRLEIDGPTDGIIYAGMVGLGFAFVENINYYIQGLGHGGVALLFTVLLRGVASPLLHPLFTSMTGLGVAYAATHRTGRVRAVLLGWLAAMVLHGIWNASSAFGLVGLGAAYLLMLCVLAAVIVVLVVDRMRLVRLIGTYLPQYAATGAVTEQDVAMLRTLGRRRNARGWAWARGGPRLARAMSDYQLAATELALLHARAELRSIEPNRFAQRRDALLGLMQQARATVLAGPSAVPPWRDSTPR